MRPPGETMHPTGRNELRPYDEIDAFLEHKDKQMKQTATLPAGPKGLPIVGNGLQFQRDPLTFMRGTQQRFGRMAHLRLANETVVAFFRPEHIRYFLMEHPRNFIKPILGNGAN